MSPLPDVTPASLRSAWGWPGECGDRGMGGEFDQLDELIVKGQVLSAMLWLRRTFDCSLKVSPGL